VGSSSDRRRLAGALAFATCVLAGRSEAWASNAAAPRVPPSFLGATCMEVVQRDRDPVLHFATGIPFQDTARTDDELPDSRTLQYFALCRGPAAMQGMPPWIDAADIARAAAIDPSVGSPGPSEVLETAAPFAGPGHDGIAGTCVIPIVPSDARIPITCAATEAGIEWDTTGVPAGAYEIWGYTFEPIASLWTPRPGVVRIVDDDDPASGGPAVAWSWPLTEVTAGFDAGVTLTGCAAGSPGTRVLIEWAEAAALDRDPERAFVPLLEIEIDGADELSIPFRPPAELLYRATFLRATAIDPEGRMFVATTRAPIVWRPGCDPPEGGTVALADACDVPVESGGPPDPSDAGGCETPSPEAEPDERDPADAQGCRSATRSRPAAIFVLVGLAIGGLRRQSLTRRTTVRSCASVPRT
jgi:hypothetical protein